MMINTTKLEYLICMSLKRLLFVSCRFPAFKDDYIKRYIDKPTTPKEDLECYISNSTSTGRKRALFLVIVYITYCLKNVYIPYQSFSTLDYDNLESNIKIHPEMYNQSFNSTSFKSFACLWTNCSRLSARVLHDKTTSTDFSYNYHYNRHEQSSALSKLARDVIVLPLFALCSPIAEVLYTPAVKLDSVGVLISAAACLNVFLLGSYTTIQQFILPAPNDMIMFICAPRATTQVARLRAGQLFFDLIASFHNFRFKPVLKLKSANSASRNCDQWSGTFSLDESPQLSNVSSQIPISTLTNSKPIDTNVENENVCRRRNAAKNLKIRALIGHADAIAYNSKLLGSGLSSPTEITSYTIKRDNLSFQGKTTQEINEITESCLPIIRTEWYRSYSARIFNHTLLVALAVIGLVGLVAFSFIVYRAHIKSRELRLVAREIERQNCSLWRTLRPSSEVGHAITSLQSLVDIGEIVKLDRIDFGWTWFAMLFGFVNLIPGFTMALLFAYYWGCLSELSIWLAELRMFLVASLVVSKFKLSPVDNFLKISYDYAHDQLSRGITPIRDQPLTQWQQVINYESDNFETYAGYDTIDTGWQLPLNSITNILKTHHFYDMKKLRQKFQTECWFIFLNFFNRAEKDNSQHETGSMNSKRIDQNHFEQFVDKLFFHLCKHKGKHNQTKSKRSVGECWQHTLRGPPSLSHEDKLTSELECMEQIYVNFRLYVEHVHGLSPCVTVAVAITYLLNYGLVFIAIMCSRKMATLKAEPMCIIVFGWFISNYLILLGANFHAEAKKLQPLLWSLVAQLTRSDNMRVQHMRYLWTKQAQMLDDSGGLALSAFRLRVTYVNIIQLALGTATIIVISMRQN